MSIAGHGYLQRILDDDLQLRQRDLLESQHLALGTGKEQQPRIVADADAEFPAGEVGKPHDGEQRIALVPLVVLVSGHDVA